MRRSRIPILAIATTLLATCATADSALDGLDADAVPQLVLEEEMRIGDVDDADYGFSQIGAVDVDRDGNVFVLERVDTKIRVYHPNGTLLRSIGGEGEGPGEFRRVTSFGVVGDTVWVTDTRLRRITLFDREGNVLETASAEGILIETSSDAVSIRIRPAAMRDDGLFTSSQTWQLNAIPESGGDTVRAPRLLFDATGAVVDTIGWWDVETPSISPSAPRREMLTVGERSIPVPEPPSDDALEQALESDSLFVHRRIATTADEASFTVVRTAIGGDTLFHRRFFYEPQGYEGAQVDTMVSDLARRGGTAFPVSAGGGIVIAGVASATSANPPTEAELEAMERAVRGALELPPFEPPVATIHHGDDDSIWLRREWDGGPDYRWLILDAEGMPRGELIAPRGITLLWTSGNTVWAARPDEFDVPWLVRFRIVEDQD